LKAQEFLSQMPGVERLSVTAGEFIGYSRGRIQILDRAGLTKRACECSWIVKFGTQRPLRRDATGKLKYLL